MNLIHGFELRREQSIEELSTEARIFHHVKTGARLMSLTNEDENKVFGITFRTPPPDSTGVAHILEHSVLCGSRRYPVKEPFVELLKGSLQTFLNAMTFPDRTCFPVASQNEQDFYNLVDVYLDAVFYPRLTPFVFQQEGWHFDLQSPDQPLAYSGVVFSEMKGAYSSPDSLLSEYSLQSLFPDTPYGFDSGGDPRKIPELSFEAFLAFHARYYHPSNAWIFFYGNGDPDRRLEVIDAYLGDFEAQDTDTDVPLQPLFEAPKQIVRPYVVGDDESRSKERVSVNWLLKETTDIDANFAFRFLDYILLGMPASPLRKALIDSGLGEDITGEGLDPELRQTYFSTGLKGVLKGRGLEVERVVLDTLRTLVKQGIDPLTVEAALNTVEFRFRENNPGQLPRGLVLMLRSLTTWLYDGDPLSLLAFAGPLERVKTAVNQNQGYFEGLIEQFFLETPHRTTLVLEPDPDLATRETEAENNRLDDIRSRMDPTKLEQIVEENRELRRRQQSPDPPEALAAMPFLERNDLERENRKIPVAHHEMEKVPLLLHELDTHGIIYLDIGFNLHALRASYLPYVRLFARALLEMGTQKDDYVSLSQRISRKTGGIHPERFTSSLITEPGSAAWLFLRSKAMASRTKDLCEIIRDVITDVSLEDRDRFRQMVLEEKARAEQRLIPAGHRVVNVRLRSHFAEADWAEEQMAGITNLFFLRELIRTLDENWPQVRATLEEIREILVNPDGMIFNVTLEDAYWPQLEQQLKELIAALPRRPRTHPQWQSQQPPDYEGMLIPSQVNYVGKACELYSLGYNFHGSALAVTRYLKNTWLWDQIRVQGGAYGAFCLLDRISGILSFLSYRDPALSRTVEVFDGSARFLRDNLPGEDEVTRSVIGAIGDLDAPKLPDAKGYISMLRHLNGDNDALRQQMRTELLETQRRHFQEFAGFLETVSDKGIVKVLGSPNAVQSANAERGEWLRTLNVL